MKDATEHSTTRRSGSRYQESSGLKRQQCQRKKPSEDGTEKIAVLYKFDMATVPFLGAF